MRLIFNEHSSTKWLQTSLKGEKDNQYRIKYEEFINKKGIK